MIWIVVGDSGTLPRMIPHKLQLKNFLSYGSDFQTINFEPYHLIYLSGRNGHGKSALLDAMTWAVWGIARKVTTAVRADQGLLRLGQLQMAVIFDFELNGQLYRVKREYLKTHNKPLAQLEFGLLNPKTDAFVPLTDKTIRATQAKIEQTIKLDYESFVNTAFLRQGNANEFSKKSPKERKEVLGSILGLQQFDRLKKRALEKIKELQGKRAAFVALQESFEKQLQQKEELHKLLESLQKERAVSEKETKQLAVQASQLTQEQQKVTQLEKQQEMARFKEQQLHEKRDAHRGSLRELFAAWRLTNKKQRHMPDLQELEKRYKQNKERLQQYEAQFKKLVRLQQEGARITQTLQACKVAIEKKILQKQQVLQIQKERCAITEKTVRQTMQDLSKKLETLRKEKAEKEKAHTERSHKICAEKKYAQLRAQFEKRKETYHAFVAQRNLFATEQETLLKKQTMVSSEDPSCPLCEQNLSAARKKFLKNKCAKEARFALHQYHRLTGIIPRLKELLVAQHAVLEEQKKYLAEHEAAAKEMLVLQEAIERTEKECEPYTKQLQAIEKEKKEIAHQEAAGKNEHERMLKADEQYTLLHEQCIKNEKQIKACAYQEKDHQKLQKEVQQIEKERDAQFALQQEVIQQSERKEAIGKEVQQLKRLKKESEALTKELKQFDTLASLKKELMHKQSEYDKHYKEQLAIRETMRERYGALVQKKEHLEQVEKETKQQQQAIKKLDLEISDYQDIAGAAGKDGIQALLIEDAIPEIEQEANQLLSRLTHNQMHIIIESLRDLKRGGTKETLDINISDPSGIRPYELFSGGEAFRIDFALRIAISKLLARRAGTALQTLIIDEGFGSQDEEGLSLIMDAIHKIQDDFEKVIVVSHLPSMRDQFPVHFNVEKGPSGSQVSVVEMG